MSCNLRFSIAWIVHTKICGAQLNFGTLFFKFITAIEEWVDSLAKNKIKAEFYIKTTFHVILVHWPKNYSALWTHRFHMGTWIVYYPRICDGYQGLFNFSMSKFQTILIYIFRKETKKHWKYNTISVKFSTFLLSQSVWIFHIYLD